MSPSDDMREYLAVVCRTARTEGDVSRTEVAARIKRGEQAVSRFEQGAGKWNPQTGALVEAYADLTGVPAWELWQMAINGWRAALAKERDQSDQDTEGAPDTQGTGLGSASSGSRGSVSRGRSDQRRKRA